MSTAKTSCGGIRKSQRKWIKLAGVFALFFAVQSLAWVLDLDLSDFGLKYVFFYSLVKILEMSYDIWTKEQ